MYPPILKVSKYNWKLLVEVSERLSSPMAGKSMSMFTLYDLCIVHILIYYL
jgi:hypothetical protein